MDLGGSGRRGGGGPKAGSVWEKRMKLDEVKGGINGAFAKTGETVIDNVNVSEFQKAVGVECVSPIPSGKRKTWKSDNGERSPLHIARQRSESSRRDSDQKQKELIVSADGIKGSPSKSEMKSDRTNGDSSELGDSKVLTKNQMIKAKSGVDVKKYDDNKVVDERKKGLEGVNGRITVAPQKPECGGEEDETDNAVSEEKDAITSQIKASFEEVTDENEDTSPQKVKQELDLVEGKKDHVKNTKKLTLQQVSMKAEPMPSHFSEIPSTSSKLQSYVDLIMWRDVSKSAFIFGIGTFAIISTSFTNSHNVSTISVASYLGLLYLSASFLFRSLISRESADQNCHKQEYVVAEEDAIWIAKQVVPVINEFLFKLRSLFSGDPATTMKLAVLLFALAQFGSSITILKMIKLGFIGVFTLPKICSSYSSHLTAHGSFWIRRFHDAWDSCSHKKVIAFVIFAFVWNSMSVVARIWAVFMLFIAFKGYQQSTIVRESETSIQRDDTASCYLRIDGGKRTVIKSSAQNQTREAKK